MFVLTMNAELVYHFKKTRVYQREYIVENYSKRKILHSSSS